MRMTNLTERLAKQQRIYTAAVVELCRSCLIRPEQFLEYSEFARKTKYVKLSKEC